MFLESLFIWISFKYMTLFPMIIVNYLTECFRSLHKVKSCTQVWSFLQQKLIFEKCCYVDYYDRHNLIILFLNAIIWNLCKSFTRISNSEHRVLNLKFLSVCLRWLACPAGRFQIILPIFTSIRFTCQEVCCSIIKFADVFYKICMLQCRRLNKSYDGRRAHYDAILE